MSDCTYKKYILTKEKESNMTFDILKLPDKIAVITQEWSKSVENSADFSKDDVIVRYDGKLCIKAVNTPVCEIKLLWKGIFDKETKILHDEWERGYGEMEWISPQAGRIMPWYFYSHKDGVTECYGIETGSNAMCWWTITENGLEFTADVRCGGMGVILGGRSLDVAKMLQKEYTDEVMEACHKFCKMMCKNPRSVKYPVYGGNDWYCCYGGNSFEKIKAHTKFIAECVGNTKNRPYMVIDDGWQLCHHGSDNDDEYFNGGPWIPNRKFEDMKKMAEEIKKIGAIPGIWFRPLWTTEEFPAEYILKFKHTKYTLDPSVPEVLSLVREDVTRIREWGYKLIKHDFTTFDIFGKWGFEMMNGRLADDTWSFKDRTKTTAEIIKKLYMTIREAAGDDIYIIGCNTVGHLSAGIFEIQRTGDDTSGLEWERTKKMGINTLAFRMSQHHAFYQHDADCVGITSKVDFEKTKMWLDLLSKSGTALFVSIADDCQTDEVKFAVKEAFKKASVNNKPSYPIDWMETKLPKKWKGEFGIDEYEW